MALTLESTAWVVVRAGVGVSLVCTLECGGRSWVFGMYCTQPDVGEVGQCERLRRVGEEERRGKGGR